MRNLLFFLFYSFVSLNLNAQDKTQDTQLWCELKLNIKIAKNIKLSLGEELRLINNSSTIGNMPTSLGLTFKIGKVYRIKPTARMSYQNGLNTFRYTLDQSLKLNLPNKIWWVNRVRLQYTHNYETPLVNFKYRFKSTLVKKLGKDVKMNFGGEIFYKDYYNFNNLSNYRLQTGLDFELGKDENGTLRLFYIFENEFNEANAQINHIYGISLNFDLF